MKLHACERNKQNLLIKLWNKLSDQSQWNTVLKHQNLKFFYFCNVASSMKWMKFPQDQSKCDDAVDTGLPLYWVSKYNYNIFSLYLYVFIKNHRANVYACVQISMYAIWLQWRAKQARKVRSRRWLLSPAKLWNWEGRWLGEQMKAGSSVQGSTVISSGKNCGEGKVNASLLVSLTIFQ